MFVIAILQSVFLSIWDGFKIPTEVTFIPALLTLLLIITMGTVEIISYRRARKQMAKAIKENNKNPIHFPIFSGRRYVHPDLFPLCDFRHSSLGDYLIALSTVFFIALAITLKAYIFKQSISYLVTSILGLMPLFLIKLLIFFCKWIAMIRRRSKRKLTRYTQWVDKKGLAHRVCYSENDITQLGSQKNCTNHMLVPGWFMLSSFFGFFICMGGLRLDNSIQVSWFLIFLPVWIIALPLCVLAILKGLTIG